MVLTLIGKICLKNGRRSRSVVELSSKRKIASTSFKNRITLVSQQLKHSALDDSGGGRLLSNR
jgi:hypothetical protein